MADDPNVQEQGAPPPRQSPFKTVTPAGGAAPRTVILRRPTLRRPGEAPTVPTAPSPVPPPPAAPSAVPPPPPPAAPSAEAAPPAVVPPPPAAVPPPPAGPASPIRPVSPLSPAGPASPIRPVSPLSPAGASQDAPKTVVLKPAIRPAAPSAPPQEGAKPLSQTAQVAQGIAISHDAAAKKMTSRISVSSATSSIPPIAPLQPGGADSVQTAKKMTSRITLESAFSTQPDIPSAQPKTIRLKRPSEVASPPAAKPSVPVSPAAPGPLPEGMTPIPPEGASQPAAEGEESPTRRKTIKVKRPGAAGGGGPKISLSRPDGVPDESDNLQSLSNFGAAPKAGSGPDKVNPIFIVAAVLAIVAGSLLVWTLAAQTYGPRGAAGDFAFPKGPNVSPPPGLTTFD